MTTRKYIFAKPGRPNWEPAVQRAARLIREDGVKADLFNCCQNVPIKYLDQLRQEAVQLNKATDEGTIPS